MKRRKTITMFVIGMAIMSWGGLISCATAPMQDASRPNNLMLAEHRAMKKRLPLVERENDVLNRENSHYRQWVRELEDNIKKLTDELAIKRTEYTHELAVKEAQINGLESLVQKLDTEKAEQLAALRNALVAQERTFLEQRQQLIHEKEQNESILSNQLIDKEKDLDNQAMQIASLMSSKANLENLLENKRLEIERLTSAKTDLQHALAVKTREMAELASANAINQAKIDETVSMIASLKKARDQSMAELESAKAANAELVKTFNELFNQLSLKKDESGTKI